MQTKLFAALDGLGAVRFVGEVDRGAACGCFCPVCASPLIARQGRLKEWHFAHEAAQERVECEVGALNMIRRVAAEVLHRNPLPTLPLYAQEVSSRSSLNWGNEVTEIASWAAQIEPAGLKWETCGLQSKPFLSGMLTTGVPFDAFIIVNDQRPSHSQPSDHGVAHLIYWVVTPTQADLLQRINLEQHIGLTGRWMWQSHPEHQGRITAARLKACQRAEIGERAMRDKLAGMREEVQRRELLDNQAREQAVAERQAQQTMRDANVPDNSALWAPERKPNSSFILYKLKHDQGTWVIYTRLDGSSWLTPFPEFDGWDESMPPALGVPETGTSAYRLLHLASAMVYLGSKAELVKTTSSVREIEQWAGLS